MAEVSPNSNQKKESNSVLGNVFSNQILSIQNKQKEVDNQNVTLIQQQENTLSLFNTSIQSLRTDIGKLSTGLSNIAFLLQKDGLEEQGRIKQEQERERILAEQEVRIGKEDALEQKIQSAVAEPVERLAPKMENTFSGIKNALGILFFGWLTNEVVQGIKNSGEKTATKFNDVKFNIIKNVGIGIGALVAIKTGFGLIKNTIGIISSKLTGLMLAPFKNLIPKGGGGGAGGAPSGGAGKGVAGLIGKLSGVATGLMNWANGENMDAVLAAASLIGPFRFIKVAAGLGYGADQIAELFGMNIFGEDPDKLKKAREIKEEAEKQIPKPQDQKSPPTESTTSTATTTTPTTTTSVPQQTLTGEKVEQTNVPSLTATPTTTLTPQQTNTSAPQISEEKQKQFEMAWNYRNNPMARGRIEGAWNNLSPEEQQQAMQWAQTKGYNWEEMKLTPKSSPSQIEKPLQSMESMQPSPAPAEISSTPAQSTQTVEVESIQPSPAQITTPPQPPQQVGSLPEPQPVVTMISSPNANQQSEPPPITNGPMTDVPMIKSSNPDNFYVLYSQFNYNVVM